MIEEYLHRGRLSYASTTADVHKAEHAEDCICRPCCRKRTELRKQGIALHGELGSGALAEFRARRKTASKPATTCLEIHEDKWDGKGPTRLLHRDFELDEEAVKYFVGFIDRVIVSWKCKEPSE